MHISLEWNDLTRQEHADMMIPAQGQETWCDLILMFKMS